MIPRLWFVSWFAFCFAIFCDLPRASTLCSPTLLPEHTEALHPPTSTPLVGPFGFARPLDPRALTAAHYLYIGLEDGTYYLLPRLTADGLLQNHRMLIQHVSQTLGIAPNALPLWNAGEVRFRQDSKTLALESINNRSGTLFRAGRKLDKTHLEAAYQSLLAAIDGLDVQNAGLEDYSTFDENHPLYVANARFDPFHTIRYVELVGAENFKRALLRKKPEQFLETLIAAIHGAKTPSKKNSRTSPFADPAYDSVEFKRMVEKIGRRTTDSHLQRSGKILALPIETARKTFNTLHHRAQAFWDVEHLLDFVARHANEAEPLELWISSVTVELALKTEKGLALVPLLLTDRVFIDGQLNPSATNLHATLLQTFAEHSGRRSVDRLYPYEERAGIRIAKDARSRQLRAWVFSKGDFRRFEAHRSGESGRPHLTRELLRAD